LRIIPFIPWFRRCSMGARKRSETDAIAARIRRRNPAYWGWAYRLPVRSSKLMADGYGRRPRRKVQSFNSRCPLIRTATRVWRAPDSGQRASGYPLTLFRSEVQLVGHPSQVGERRCLHFRMTWPRWTFTVISLMPIPQAICCYGDDDHLDHSPCSRGVRVPKRAHSAATAVVLAFSLHARYRTRPC
jgi:hypothetical protein